jgi:transposase
VCLLLTDFMIPFEWRCFMGKSHSLDIRERVVAMVEAGHSCRAAARRFAIGDSTAIRVMQRRRKTGAISPPRQGRPLGRGKLAAYRSFLIAQVEASPDITMPELAERLDEAHGVRVPPSSLSRVLVAEGFTYKKSPYGVGMRTRDGAAGS